MLKEIDEMNNQNFKSLNQNPTPIWIILETLKQLLVVFFL